MSRLLEKAGDSVSQSEAGTRRPEGATGAVRSFAWLLGLALFWALEDFLIQGAAFDVSPSYHHPYAYALIRFALNFSFATTTLLLLPRTAVCAVFLADFFVSFVVLAYARYFHEPLSLHAMRAAGEGLKVAGFAVQLISIPIWIALIVALAGKLFWISRLPRLRAVVRWPGAGAMLVLAVGILVVMQFGSYRFSSVRSTRGSSITYMYGYPLTWMAQRILGPDMKEIAAEIYRLRALPHEQLAGTEAPWPVGDKIAVVQLESYEWNMLHFKINGEEVSPYINSLSRRSRLFRVRAYHNTGSADMDFAVLSGGEPDPRIINYAVPGVLYTNSLPQFLKREGYRSVSFHGNSGSFFNRRPNFKRMGVDEMWFLQEFGSLQDGRSSWGARDRDIFRLSSEKLHKASSPEFHFSITLDSHAPFNLISDGEKEIFPGSHDWRENYFNSIRALDCAVSNYVESLPKGTFMVLYGDHTSGVTYGEFSPAREGPREYVPCFIHVCGSLDWLPENNAPVTNISELRILDVMNFLKSQVRRNERSGETVAASRP